MTYAETMDRAAYCLRSAEAHMEAGETGLANWRADAAIRYARACGLGAVEARAAEIYAATGGDG